MLVFVSAPEQHILQTKTQEKKDTTKGEPSTKHRAPNCRRCGYPMKGHPKNQCNKKE